MPLHYLYARLMVMSDSSAMLNPHDFTEGGQNSLEVSFQQDSAKQKIVQLNAELEEKVRQRTVELERKNAALQELNRNLVGREYRIRELECENEMLRQRLQDNPNVAGWLDGQPEGLS